MSAKLKARLLMGGVALGGLYLALAACAGAPAPIEVEAVQLSARASDEAEGYSAAPEMELAAPMEDALPGSGGALQQVVERLIIRTGNISMTVEDTRATRDAIEQMVERMTDEGAFVISVNEYGGVEGESPYINMSIRVPAERFDEVMDALAGMAVDVTSRNESGQDVTEEYVDLAARLQSLETARDRLLGLMENADTTEDLLLAEQQLTQREAEIESIRGRMQYLEESAALSRIDIDLQPYILSQPVDTTWRPAETIRQAIDDLLDNLQGLGSFLIYFSIACLPFLLVFGAIGYGIFRFVRWRVQVRRERQAAHAAAEE